MKFGSKKYFAGLRDLVRAPVQLGTFVMWMKADDEVARGRGKQQLKSKLPGVLCHGFLLKVVVPMG